MRRDRDEQPAETSVESEQKWEILEMSVTKTW